MKLLGDERIPENRIWILVISAFYCVSRIWVTQIYYIGADDSGGDELIDMLLNYWVLWAQLAPLRNTSPEKNSTHYIGGWSVMCKVLLKCPTQNLNSVIYGARMQEGKFPGNSLKKPRNHFWRLFQARNTQKRIKD